jgi:hypothetical protein
MVLIMTLTGRIASFTSEQREKLGAAKTADELDAFLTAEKIELTAEEKKTVIEYLTTGTAALADDDLDAVAGGASKVDPIKGCPICGYKSPVLMGPCPKCSSAIKPTRTK